MPAVAVTAPVAGSSSAVSDVRIEWDATDADGDDLSFAVFFSADDGESWNGVVTRTAERSLVPVVGILEPTQAGRILVTVSDGVNASYFMTESFTLRPG